MDLRRRRLLTTLVGTSVVGVPVTLAAQSREVWSAAETWAALQEDRVRLLDIRSREEWRDSGVAEGAWPVSMHEKLFPERLFEARNLAEDRPVALICATGGRTGSVMRALRRAGYDGFVDVSEGMFGNRRGRGWIAEKLPIVSAEIALTGLPASLT